MRRVGTMMPALALTAGALVPAVLITGDGPWRWWAAALASLLAAIAVYGNPRRGLVYAVCGIAAAALSAYMLSPSPYPPGNARMRGTVTTLSYSRAGQGAVLETGDGRYRCCIVTDQGKQMHPGEIVECSGYIEPVGKYADVPYMHDRDLVAKAERLSGVMVVPSEAIRVIGHDNSLWYNVSRLRDDVVQHIYDSPLDDTSSSLLVAACFGTGDAAVEIKDRFRATGLSHLLCVSGFHVAIVAWLLAMLSWPAKIWARGGRLRYIVILGGVWLFAMFTGAQPSAIRAALMISAFYVGRLLQRDTIPFNNLVLAIGLMLIYNPYWLYSIGFQLSVTAVAGLLVFSGVLNPIPLQYKTLRNAIALFVVPLAAMIGTAPVVLFWFHRLPLMSIPVNALASLLFPIFIIMGLASVMTGWVWSGVVADKICGIILDVCDIAYGAVGTSFDNIYMSAATMAVLATIIVLMAAIALSHNAKLRMAMAGIALVALVICCIPSANPASEAIAVSDARGSMLLLRRGGRCDIISSGKRPHIDVSEYLTACRVDTVYHNMCDIIALDGNVVGMASRNNSSRHRCDILLVDGSYDGDPEALIQSHAPKKVLLGANMTTAMAEAMAGICGRYDVELHNLADKAVYIKPYQR